MRTTGLPECFGTAQDRPRDAAEAVCISPSDPASRFMGLTRLSNGLRGVRTHLMTRFAGLPPGWYGGERGQSALALSRSVMYHRNTSAVGIAAFPRAVGGMELANFAGPAGSLCRLIHVKRQVGAQLPICFKGKPPSREFSAAKGPVRSPASGCSRTMTYQVNKVAAAIHLGAS